MTTSSRQQYCLYLLFTLAFIVIVQNTFAQTPGFIYKPAVNGGNKVLDPNGDGYISKTNTGFSGTNDEGTTYSEIPYRSFPTLSNEVVGDIITGTNGGHTDLVPSQSAGATGSPIAAYYDGKNVMFRVRIGKHSTASKGYSIMIDADNQFGNLVSGSSPSSTPNPGFEYEVVLASNFDVGLYDHRNKPDGGTKIWAGSTDQYFQRAIAASTGSGDEDYFYDFYLPLTAFGSGITADTKLRMTGITITSAQSGISGTVSDVGGVNFSGSYSGDARNAWSDVINTFPSVSLNELMNGGFPSTTPLAKPPVITSAIFTSTTSISGTSVEAAGSTITVYKNGVAICGSTLTCPTVNASGSWTLSGITYGTLNGGDKITATVTATGKPASLHSTAVDVVALASFCTTTTPPIITGIANGSGGNKLLAGTTSYPGQQVIKLYSNGATSTTVSVTVTATGTSAPYAWEFPNSMPLAAGMWAVTTTPTGMCESFKSNEVCYNGNGQMSFNNTTVSITSVTYADLSTSSSSTVRKDITIISGTVSKTGDRVYIYKNGERTAFSISPTSTTWQINVSGLSLTAPDIITARSIESGVKNGNYNCGDIASNKSNALTVTAISTAPTISGNYCGTTTSISGTSTEASGTTIKVYNGATLLGTTTVNSWGSWTATGLSIAPGTTITAKATAVNKFESSASASVTIGTVYSASGLAITNPSPVIEGATSISGTAPAGAYVTLYINNEPYVNNSGVAITALADGTGNWTISGISPFELYAGASLTIKAKASTSSFCESAASPAVTVECKPAITSITATFSSPKYCPDTNAIINLSSSENGVIYNIYKKNTDGTFTRFGSSVLGTGSPISITSDVVSTTGTILQIKTIKVGAPCQYIIGGEMTVDLYPAVPRNFTVTAVPETSGCANVSVTITLQSAEAGYSYQLINNDTKAIIGNLIVPTAAENGMDIVFDPITVAATTTYGVVISGVNSGCKASNTILKTITISGGPDVTRSVTIDKSTVCLNTSAIISVSTQNTYTYKIYDQSSPSTLIATFTGNGASVSTTIPTTYFSAVGTKTFYVTVTGGGCSDLLLSQKVNVTVTDGTGGTVSAGSNQTLCAVTTTTLAGSIPEPGSGVWTIKTKATGSNPVFANNTLYNTQVTGLISGTYEFTWTVTSACSGAVTSSTVKVEVNCAAEFSVKTTKFVQDYVNGDVLVTMSDVDGGIVSASIFSGSIPPGTTFNTSTGELIVTDQTLLLAGNYLYTARTTDAMGKTTNSPISLRMYSSSTVPSPAPFSVELVSFDALFTNQNVVLTWITASEENNDKFEIERSTNGFDFTSIGNVNGKGNASQRSYYTFADTHPLPGVSYYRLKQLDFDGKYTYSKMVSVVAEGINTNIIQVYPNPFQSNVALEWTSLQEENTLIVVSDLCGKEVKRELVKAASGINSINLNLSPLIPSGMYLIKVMGEKTKLSAKMVKSK